jgi:hypothetical protein
MVRGHNCILKAKAIMVNEISVRMFPEEFMYVYTPMTLLPW